MRIYVTASGLARSFSTIPASVNAAALRGVQEGARASIPILRRYTRSARPSYGGLVGAVATERYLWNWKSRPLRDGATILNDQSYAAIVEVGQRRGEMPPTANLVRWLAFRFGYDPSSPRTWRIARGICLSIYRRGLRARLVMNKAVPEVVDLVHMHVAAYVAVELSKL